MNQPPRATNQVSLHHRGHLVTSLPHVEPMGIDELIAVRLVDLAIERASVNSQKSDQIE